MNLLALTMLTAAVMPGTPSVTDINVLVNGSAVVFEDQRPIMVGSRVLVPMRGVFEKLGATVKWNDAEQKVSASNSASNVQLWIGNRTATVNGRAISMDVPARLVNGRTMVPLRFLSESLGADVRWKSDTTTVIIITPNAGRVR